MEIEDISYLENQIKQVENRYKKLCRLGHKIQLKSMTNDILNRIPLHPSEKRKTETARIVNEIKKQLKLKRG